MIFLYKQVADFSVKRVVVLLYQMNTKLNKLLFTVLHILLHLSQDLLTALKVTKIKDLWNINITQCENVKGREIS